MEMLNTEKPESSNRIETPSNSNRNTIHPNTTEQTLTQEEKMNIVIMKRIMSKKKTTLPSLSNQDWKTVKAETEKVNKLLTNVSTNNITELNELRNYMRERNLSVKKSRFPKEHK